LTRIGQLENTGDLLVATRATAVSAAAEKQQNQKQGYQEAAETGRDFPRFCPPVYQSKDTTHDAHCEGATGSPFAAIPEPFNALAKCKIADEHEEASNYQEQASVSNGFIAH
jgi:hypothetical protein